MKYHKYISILFFITLFIYPIISYAGSVNLTRPIGGKIIKVGKSAEIVCLAMSGPIFIVPFNIGVPGPFFIRITTKGKPKVGGYILGNYKVKPDTSTCANPETGVPIPAFELTPYGVSK